MLAGFALAALVASALAEVVPGVAKVDLGTPPLLPGPCVQELRYHARGVATQGGIGLTS